MKPVEIFTVMWIPMAAGFAILACLGIAFRENWKNIFTAGFVGMLIGAAIGGIVWGAKHVDYTREVRKERYRIEYGITYVEFGSDGNLTFRKNDFLCEAKEGFDDLHNEIIFADSVQCSQEGDEREILENPR